VALPRRQLLFALLGAVAGLELDPLYVDTIIRRWQSFSGDRACHAETGQFFNQREAEGEAEHRGE
jgi:hypothetical protein